MAFLSPLRYKLFLKYMVQCDEKYLHRVGKQIQGIE